MSLARTAVSGRDYRGYVLYYNNTPYTVTRVVAVVIYQNAFVKRRIYVNSVIVIVRRVRSRRRVLSPSLRVLARWRW